MKSVTVLRQGDPLANPLAGNPFRTRSDLELGVRALQRPLSSHFSPGSARVRLGSTGVLFGAESEQLEGFARPLFGLVALHRGGGTFDEWDRYCQGLAHGTDPRHSEFWGFAGTDQRLVEMAAIGFALAFAADQVWEPLSAASRENLVRWLARINCCSLPNCNWHFFRVLVNLGLRSVGAPDDPRAEAESLDQLETHYDRAGFYHDGQPERIDYYVPWAYHTYGLIYASSEHARPDFAARYRARAREFAQAFEYRFDAHGRAVPFGRSLTYRFAQAAFWSALVFADERALPWSQVKGLLLRHLRYWTALPISDRDGVLSLGYAYANSAVCEPYSSACSPYWCTKGFLALGAPAEHPFWQAPEEDAATWNTRLAPLRAETVSGSIWQRDRSQSVMLSAGQHELKWPNTAAKYGKFAYSSAFGFSLSPSETQPAHGVHDSMLALREPDGRWRVRVQSFERRVEGPLLASRWAPWSDVEIQTLLVATELPWHLRLHRIRTGRALSAAEQGFALGRGPSEGDEVRCVVAADGRSVLATTPLGSVGIFDVPAGPAGLRTRLLARSADLQYPLPATNVVWPRTVIPRLQVALDPGEHWLGCAVFATEAEVEETVDELRPRVPAFPTEVLDWF